MTQLDSFTGTSISRDRLARCLGGSLEVVRGKQVLEAGCGAGRFTELLLESGAEVFACDLSTAVEANHDNCSGAPGYFVCQADILNLPTRPESFDFVICLGVIQHTPNPDHTIAALCRCLKPGGVLVIDHYRYDASDMTLNRQRLRRFLIRRSPRFSLLFIRSLVALLWPVHKVLWKYRAHPAVARLRQHWAVFSPVLDYQDYYGELGPKLLYAWAALDTHDALTDRYKHKRTTEQIEERLAALGMVDASVNYGGNGVEARVTRPTVPAASGAAPAA